MMEARAVAKYVRFGPRKIKRYADLVRGKALGEARGILAVSSSPAAKALSLCMESAVANAENNHEMDVKDLAVKTVMVDGALKMARLMPRARGRADRYVKRTCHITVVMTDGAEE
ncbi:MAG: 50S ribosomal protein L22 [Armatimonadia bacterium]